MTVKIISGENFNCGTVDTVVHISAEQSHNNLARFAVKPIDTCIADIVEALVDAEIYTDGCCCGHGVADGNIILTDGRVLSITFPEGWHKKD